MSLLTALSLWLLLFDNASGQLQDAFGQHAWLDALRSYIASYFGLAAGLALLFAGVAAIMIRRQTRRAVQDAFDAEQASLGHAAGARAALSCCGLNPAGPP